MRKILFRGKRVDNGEWIVGHLLTFEDGRARINESHTDVFCYEKDSSIIQTVAHEVYPETVGQFTGLTDKNGKRIFEGDIIHELDGSMDDIPRMVRWDEELLAFQCPLIRKHWCYGYNDISLWMMQSKNTEVIGNIHDNPELLEVSDGK